MKDAVARFINNHPIMTFLLADSAIGVVGKTLTVLLRGYPPQVEKPIEEVEVVEETSSED